MSMQDSVESLAIRAKTAGLSYHEWDKFIQLCVMSFGTANAGAIRRSSVRDGDRIFLLRA